MSSSCAHEHQQVKKNAASGHAAFERDANHYFSDGNICLAVENTVFKLHRGILCRHSEVFSSMFAFPPPEAGQEAYEGCPVVRLVDALDDFRPLVQILYDAP